MNKNVDLTIQSIHEIEIPKDRQAVLQSLIDYIQKKKDSNKPIRLNFICTHNSRRSHLSQIWAQVASHYYNIDRVDCYSGGTEATAMFPMIKETLIRQGFEVTNLSDGKNPVYALSFDESERPIIAFSKVYDHGYNPASGFGSVMTCSSADKGCPLVLGSEKRIPVLYEDPKVSDGTDQMEATYETRSRQIGSEMMFVFKNIK